MSDSGNLEWRTIGSSENPLGRLVTYGKDKPVILSTGFNLIYESYQDSSDDGWVDQFVRFTRKDESLSFGSTGLKFGEIIKQDSFRFQYKNLALFVFLWNGELSKIIFNPQNIDFESKLIKRPKIKSGESSVDFLNPDKLALRGFGWSKFLVFKRPSPTDVVNWGDLVRQSWGKFDPDSLLAAEKVNSGIVNLIEPFSAKP